MHGARRVKRRCPMRLLLVGEHVLLLEGLMKLLHDQTGAEIRAVTQQDEAQETARRWEAEVIVVETSNVPAAATRLVELRAAAPSVPLVVIAPGDQAQFLAALRAGARGFVGRDATADQLAGCIKAVWRGEWGVPRAFMGMLAEAYLELAATTHRSDPIALTDRERNVLDLLVRGLSTAHIGQQLFLSESTVRADIRSLIHKLGVANRVQLVAEALRRGLTSIG